MNKNKKLVFLSMLVAQALVLYTVERMIPVPFITPGAKLGLSNIVTVTTLYLFGLKDALVVLILRILLSTFLGGSVSSFLYSFAGGVLSAVTMYLVKRAGKQNVSIIGISIVGAFFHNVGQVLVAALIIVNIKIVLYLPVLTIAAVGTGFFVGVTGKYLLGFLKKVPYFALSEKE